MKRLRNITISILIIILLMTLALPSSVSANSGVIRPQLVVELSNLPEGAAHVDIAIRAPDDRIVDLAEAPPDGVSKDSPLARGEYGEFISYSFRVAQAISHIEPDEHNTVTFYDPSLIQNSKQIRLVIADQKGEILQLSDPFDITIRNYFELSLNFFTYDAAADSLHVRTEIMPLAVALYILFGFIGLVITCFVEWFVGVAFKLTKKHTKLIVITNVISQILMRVLFVLLYGLLPQYILLTVLLEILVYTGEFIAYRFLAKDVPAGKWLQYVLAANTASVLAGMLLNLYLR